MTNLSVQSRPEDLTQVDGIGDHYATRLAEAGITTPHDLAEADIDELSQRTGLSVRPLRRWQRQACERVGIAPPAQPTAPADERGGEDAGPADQGSGSKLWEGFKDVLAWIAIGVIGIMVLGLVFAGGIVILLIVIVFGWAILSLFQ